MAGSVRRAWRHLIRGDDRRQRPRRRMFFARSADTSSTVFLILRRMRAPLIVLITIFAVSVLGLTLIPGRDDAGQPARMGFFDAFYFMSYTATTIGYGEIPHPFTDAQRLWVMATIYLTVVGWAYAIGSLLTLLQDRAFRQALGLQRFTRTVSRLREPFLLIVGYGQTGQLLGRSLDAIGRRFVVLDVSFALDPELLPQAATSSTAAATATARVVIILRLIGSSPGPIAAHGGRAVTRRSNLPNAPDHRWHLTPGVEPDLRDRRACAARRARRRSRRGAGGSAARAHGRR